jgi:hypothetical protein
LMLASLKQPWYFGDMELLHKVAGDFTVTFMVSTATYLLIEAPVLLVEKYLYTLRNSVKKQKDEGVMG